MTVIKNPTYSIHPEKPGVFVYETPMLYGWHAHRAVLEIPKGEETDFASIPRFMRAMYDINGKHRRAAAVHDYLYGQAGWVTVSAEFTRDGFEIELDKAVDIRYTRQEADYEFYRIMLADGVRKSQAYLMYKTVRIFGGAHIWLTRGKQWRAKRA